MADKKKVKIVDEKEEKTIIVKIKPAMADDVKAHFEMRKEKKKRTPHFRRQEWFRYKRLGTSWRRPTGLHSKQRKNLKYRPANVNIGHRGPTKARGLHPSGFQEVMVFNTKDLDKIDPAIQCARIGHSVGTKKRIDIVAKSKKLKIKVLNGGI